MALFVLLIAVPLLAIIAFLLAVPKDKGLYQWIQFYAKGKDSGFSLWEIGLLRKVAIRTKLEEPSSLYWSVATLDRCINSLVKKSRLTGDEKTPETQNFLAKLYAYRKKIEFDQPRYKKGLKSTKSIEDGQRLKVLVEGVGVFEASVLRNTDRFLTISRPVGVRTPPDFFWKTRRLAIYFWRKVDAGYVFDTYVLDEVTMRGLQVLQLAHTDSLFRSQKRKSVRKATYMSAYLYLPTTEDHPEKLETQPGMRCVIEDISEDGAAVVVGGKANIGLRVKLQFDISGETLAMSGIVRSVSRDEEKNRSILHIEAIPLSLRARNLIQAVVFGVDSRDDVRRIFGAALDSRAEAGSNSGMENASATQNDDVPNDGGA